MNIWYLSDYEAQVNEVVQRLKKRGVNTTPQVADKINAKFLRLNPTLALVFDQDGLSICANGMKIQPDWSGEIGRLKRATLKSEMLARACQANEYPTLIDATAGLGHDTLLLAKFGAKVTLVERHPILFTLLEYAYQKAKSDDFLNTVVSNITLVFADSAQYLKQQALEKKWVDVVYLDPMFPQRDQNSNKKQAQVKKQMQLLHLLLPCDGEMDLGDDLLSFAQRLAKRVIVKRPRHAVFLNNESPQNQWLGDACRFDGYFQLPN